MDHIQHTVCWFSQLYCDHVTTITYLTLFSGKCMNIVIFQSIRTVFWLLHFSSVMSEPTLCATFPISTQEAPLAASNVNSERLVQLANRQAGMWKSILLMFNVLWGFRMSSASLLWLFVTLPPKMSRTDTRSQYRMWRYLICKSKILIFSFHQNWVLHTFFCLKTLLLMVKCDVLRQFQAFSIVAAAILWYAKQIFSAQFLRMELSTVARLIYQ